MFLLTLWLDLLLLETRATLQLLVLGGLLRVVHIYYSLATSILHTCRECQKLVAFSSEVSSGTEGRRH
jgi:hypothetical protein